MKLNFEVRVHMCSPDDWEHMLSSAMCVCSMAMGTRRLLPFSTTPVIMQTGKNSYYICEDRPVPASMVSTPI